MSIEELSKEQILGRDIFDYIFSIDDVFDREKTILKLEDRAAKLLSLIHI